MDRNPETKKKIEDILEWAKGHGRPLPAGTHHLLRALGYEGYARVFASADLVTPSPSDALIPDSVPLGWDKEERVVWATGTIESLPIAKSPIKFKRYDRHASTFAATPKAALARRPGCNPCSRTLRETMSESFAMGRDLVIYDENLCEVDRYRCGDYVEER